MRDVQQFPILCDECNRPIESRNNLVVVWRFFTIRPFHEGCYAKSLKTARSLILGNYPINGFEGTLAAVLGPILGSIALAVSANLGRTGLGIIYFLLFLLPLITRLYSWWKYESRLP
jgi:antibiotic biosynthesis monooxygenase (ABM) superfamily enzyme